MKSARFAAATIVTAFVLGGCSQSASVPTMPTTHPVSDGLPKATFVMHWPASASRASARSRDFVSASTQSIAVQVNSLTPIVVNRPSSSGVPTSNIVLTAPAGTDVISFKLYDQDGAAGNLLGEAAVSQPISDTTANTVSATINGTLGKIALGPTANQGFVEGTALGGYVLVGEVGDTFVATAEDADGNVIVAPGTVPAITCASSSTAIAVTAGSTINQFTLKPTAVSGNAALLCSGTGTAINQSFSVSESAAIYVPNFDASTMAVYDQNGSQIKTTGSFPNLHDPLAAALDPKNGDVYVTNVGSETITVYTGNGVQVSTSGSFPNLSGVEDIVFDPANADLYVTNFNDNTITVYDSSGNQVTESGGFANLSGPDGLTFDSVNSTFYVTNYKGGTITAYDQSGNQVSTAGTFPNVTSPAAIAFDAANTQLYVGNEGAVLVYDQNGNQVATS